MRGKGTFFAYIYTKLAACFTFFWIALINQLYVDKKDSLYEK